MNTHVVYQLSRIIAGEWHQKESECEWDRLLILEVLILTNSFTQSLQKKLETLENDFAVHEIRVQNVCTQGEDILSKVRYTPGIPRQNKDLQKGIGPNIES